VFPETPPKQFDKSWAATGHPGGGSRVIIHSLYLEPEELERHVHKLFAKYKVMVAKEQRHELFMTDDQPPIMLCAYGTTARIAKSAIRELRRKGIKVGLFRPITAWPFPEPALEALVEPTRSFFTIEMNMGQMVEDVRMVVRGRRPVHFWGRTGGMVPTVEEIVAKITEHNATLGA
jgi:2-oxoglutarate ferredoxin oxidoreductase subunit alpha